MNEIILPIIEDSAELLKYQNVAAIYYELYDILIQFQQSEDQMQKLTQKLINCELIYHKMFATSMSKLLEHFDKFKSSKSILLLFQKRQSWLHTKIKDAPVLSWKLAPTFIGHHLVNKFLASEEKEWTYNAFNDVNHVMNFIKKHTFDCRNVKMSLETSGGKARVKFVKFLNDEILRTFKSNKEEFELIRVKLGLFKL